MQNLVTLDSFGRHQRGPLSKQLKVINMETISEILFYIFITIGYLCSAAAGVIGCICFTVFLLFLVVFYAAPQLALVICGILLLAWGLDR